jgi:hypothetical protein
VLIGEASSDLSRFEFVREIDKHTKLYMAVVYSVSLRRNIRLAYLLKEKDRKQSYVLLFCTDLEIAPYVLRRGTLSLSQGSAAGAVARRKAPERILLIQGFSED